MGPEALLREKIKQRRHREGYDEGISSSHKVASALAFVASEAPVEMLGQFTRLELDGAGSWQVWTVWGGEWAGQSHGGLVGVDSVWERGWNERGGVMEVDLQVPFE